MKHDFEWVNAHAKWCLITIKSYSTGWTDYSYGFMLSYLLASNGMLGYFETSAVWRDCHSIIDKLWCQACL